jgi:hypothetical protein
LVIVPPGLGSVAATLKLAVVPLEERTALAAWVTVGGWAYLTVALPVTVVPSAAVADAWTVSEPTPEAGAE